MRSWFSLIALIGFAVGALLLIWAGWYYTAPAWVADWGWAITFALASVAGTVALFRREHWRAGSSFLIGIMLGIVLAEAFMAGQVTRNVLGRLSIEQVR